MENTILLLVGGPIILIVLVILSFFTVEQQTFAVIETFGKFSRIAGAGLQFRIPFIQRIAGRGDLRVNKLDIAVETKTRDNVFVVMKVSVQYCVLDTKEKMQAAFYRLGRPHEQIQAYIFNVVRSHVPKMTLDDVFEKKDDIEEAVSSSLTASMDEYGFGFKNVLITDIEPDAKVKAAMNGINAAARLLSVAEKEAEAAKVRMVRAAEAEAESKQLQGKGIAQQRLEIARGLAESLHTVEKDSRISPESILMMLMSVQYFDMLASLGQNGGLNTIMVPHSPSGAGDVLEQFRHMVTQGNLLASAVPPKPATNA